MVKYKFIDINSVNKKKPAKFEALNSFYSTALTPGPRLFTSNFSAMRLALSWLFSLASKSATGVSANLFSPQLLQVQGGFLLLQGLPQPGPGGAQHQVLGLRSTPARSWTWRPWRSTSETLYAQIVIN